ncbi:hypothetical protein KP509_39G034000 [Ceratopteris richardii]|uniref:RING-type domain-containing protein n=1 Tax=Ceratopteris richardii TaxID=49495 RepID=A0A8T2PZM1_CERRI|nr:hypothetical protein KP509_39G034000 [Ceratopteris richardii]
MSNSAVASDRAVSSSTSASGANVLQTPPRRTGRSSGKGRRRRAAAEQRQTELEALISSSNDGEEDVYLAPPREQLSRRQLRRSTRRMQQNWVNSYYDDEHSLDIALAVSLSLSEGGDRSVNSMHPYENRLLDMSYESLVTLENVRCTAPLAVVNLMMGHVFNKDTKIISPDCVEELCTICQVEYREKDLYMLLPCTHTFHDTCGSEWFLNHSKLCPVCKYNITEDL